MLGCGRAPRVSVARTAARLPKAAGRNAPVCCHLLRDTRRDPALGCPKLVGKTLGRCASARGGGGGALGVSDRPAAGTGLVAAGVAPAADRRHPLSRPGAAVPPSSASPNSRSRRRETRTRWARRRAARRRGCARQGPGSRPKVGRTTRNRASRRRSARSPWPDRRRRCRDGRPRNTAAVPRSIAAGVSRVHDAPDRVAPGETVRGQSVEQRAASRASPGLDFAPAVRS